jgi:gluconokinase
MIEGDDYHSAANREKMARGVPLTDDDRQGWLDSLGRVLRAATGKTVLTCSALKRAYRDSLRAADPELRFVYLAVTPEEASRRVLVRAASHFFPVNLVASQFAALEVPDAEPGVLAIDATMPIDSLARRAAEWLVSEGWR